VHPQQAVAHDCAQSCTHCQKCTIVFNLTKHGRHCNTWYTQSAAVSKTANTILTQVSLMETDFLRCAQHFVNQIELCCPPGRCNEWADGNDIADNQKVTPCMVALSHSGQQRCLLCWGLAGTLAATD
jgi:hypothetical protein